MEDQKIALSGVLPIVQIGFQRDKSLRRAEIIFQVAKAI
jgi:hypothetical protein